MGISQRLVIELCENSLEVLERIVHAVSMGGNMVVNFGPQADGDFRREEKKEMADAIGKWMQQYGECIYGCDYAGWDKQPWGYYTHKGKRGIYDCLQSSLFQTLGG